MIYINIYQCQYTLIYLCRYPWYIHHLALPLNQGIGNADIVYMCLWPQLMYCCWMLKHSILSWFAVVLLFVYVVHILGYFCYEHQYFYYCFGCVLGTSIIGFMQEYFLVDGKVINSAFSADIGTDKWSGWFLERDIQHVWHR